MQTLAPGAQQQKQNDGGNMKKYLAELVGTFILVLFGCGTAVVAGDKVGILGHCVCLRAWPDCGRIRDRAHLRMPHQSSGEPGSLDGRTDDNQET